MSCARTRSAPPWSNLHLKVKCQKWVLLSYPLHNCHSLIGFKYLSQTLTIMRCVTRRDQFRNSKIKVKSTGQIWKKVFSSCSLHYFFISRRILKYLSEVLTTTRRCVMLKNEVGNPKVKITFRRHMSKICSFIAS